MIASLHEDSLHEGLHEGYCAASAFACRVIASGVVVLAVFVLAVSGFAGPLLGAEPASVSFSRNVLPILSRSCFTCHGPDEATREAGLRLDRADAIFGETANGTTAVVPGDLKGSELYVRVTSQDEQLVMPPATSGHKLTGAQTEILRLWIEQGARVDDHWSFGAIVDSTPPEVRNGSWVRNAIDRFVLARLEQEGITPSAEADRETLIRRLSLDLLGLPASVDETESFVNDTSPNAYERLVDRMLVSPHLGERWGRFWLDLAHYADSDGYLGDALRPHAWIYRDWVIDAINNDLPFDRFTIEQLAGDLLPSAQQSQRVATGFLRNTMRNTEAGVDLEEYRLKEIVDRVNTIGVGWLGLSLGCAECHSHKYDPISQREFYQIFAFFNDADDIDISAQQPEEMRLYKIAQTAWESHQESLRQSLESRWGSRSVDDPVSLGDPMGDLAKLLADLAEDPSKQTLESKQTIAAMTQSLGSDFQDLCDQYQKHQQQKPKPPSTKAMTIAARKSPRKSFVHLRGDYRDRGEDVQPATPAVFPPMNRRGWAADRLDFAHWLVASENPLTARVAVNQIWQQLFGRGIVSSSDNFGVAGDPPSHPELLDWLATQYVRRGWSRKEMIRLIVTSATYRQSSVQRSDLERLDPENVLLARQARFRLDAENIRDVALAAAGLIERQIGGPSIRPPQPSYISSISRNAQWPVSTGRDLYRRGLYILFRRATPYPTLLTFDAPDSTTVCVRRERSNSPLQALTLLNDPVFFEASQALGGHLASETATSVEQRLSDGFRRCLGRGPSAEELDRLNRFWNERLHAFQAEPKRAIEVVTPSIASSPHAVEQRDVSNPAEQAAWILTARVLMNLDLFLTRE